MFISDGPILCADESPCRCIPGDSGLMIKVWICLFRKWKRWLTANKRIIFIHFKIYLGEHLWRFIYISIVMK